MSLRDLQQLLERQQALVAKVEAEQKQQLELLQRQLDRAQLEKNEAQRIQRQLHEQLIEMEKIEHRLQQRSDELCHSLLEIQEKFQALQQKNSMLTEDHEAKEKEFETKMKLFSTAEKRSIELEQQLKTALLKNKEQNERLVDLESQIEETNQALSENYHYKNEIKKLRSDLHKKEDTIRDLQISINIAHQNNTASRRIPSDKPTASSGTPSKEILENNTSAFVTMPEYLSSEGSKESTSSERDVPHTHQGNLDETENHKNILSDVNTDFFLLGGIGEKLKHRSHLSEATLTPPAFKSAEHLNPKSITQNNLEPQTTQDFSAERSHVKIKTAFDTSSNPPPESQIPKTKETLLPPQEAIEDIISNPKIKSPQEIQRKISQLEAEFQSVCYPQERLEQEHKRKKYFAQLQTELKQEISSLERDLNKSVDNLKQQYARQRSQLETEAAKDVLQAQEELSLPKSTHEKQERLTTLSVELKRAVSEAKELQEDLDAAWLLPERKEQIEQRLSENEARQSALHNEINVINQSSVAANAQSNLSKNKHQIERKIEQRTLKLSKDLEQLSKEENSTVTALKQALKAQISEATNRIEQQIEDNNKKLQQELAILAELYERKGINLIQQKNELLQELKSIDVST